MEPQQAQEKGTYLYAVVPASSSPKLEGVEGVEQGKVYTVASGGLAAVVSDVPSREEMRPERKHLSAHQQVLRRVTDTSPVVLPVSFGTIAESADGVRSMLNGYQQQLSEQMKKVEGKLEMRLRLVYASEKPTIYEHLVAQDEGLRQMRDRILGGGRQATREEKIDLGQKFDAVLSQLREAYARQLEQALAGIAELKGNPPRSEKELVNVACLVPKDRQADFDAAVQKAAGTFPDTFSLQPSGPVPPYDFVELHLKTATAH